MKRLTIALIGTGLFVSSLSSYALSPACHAGYSSGLCAPKNCGGLYLGVTGLWLQGMGTGAGLNSEGFQRETIISTTSDTHASFESSLKKFNPHYKWAWEAKIGYDLPYTSNNIELNYLHYGNTTTRSENVDPSINHITPFFLTDVIAFLFPSAPKPFDDGLKDLHINSSLHHRLDQADLIFGRQYNDVCGKFSLHPYVGVRYAQLKHEYNSDMAASYVIYTPFLPASPTDSVALHSSVNSEFKGAGPVFGLTTRYGLLGGLGIVGHFDSSLLAGTVHSYTNVVVNATPVALVSPVEQESIHLEGRFNSPSTNRLATTISGKLGLDYNYCFCNKSSLTVEVGYQASKYFNTFDLIRGDIFSPTRITDIVIDNFDIRGPYMNLTYHL
jgi:hypothetical protein